MLKIFVLSYLFRQVYTVIDGEVQNDVKLKKTTKDSFLVNPVSKELMKDARQKLMSRLSTVDSDPVYDYKDMWWKTIRKLQQTTFVTKVDDINRFKKDTPIKGLRTTVGLQVLTKQPQAVVIKNESKNTFDSVKSLIAHKISKAEDILRSKTDINIEDYIYQDMQNSLDLHVLITNETDIITNQDVDIKEMKNVYNNSIAIIKDIEGINTSTILEYYNFTANQFGDTDYQDYNGTTQPIRKTTWRLIKPGEAAFDLISPVEEKIIDENAMLTTNALLEETTAPPDEGMFLETTSYWPYKTPLPEYIIKAPTPEMPKDYMAALKVYKNGRKEGYFSTFLMHLFLDVAEKPTPALRLLYEAVAREFSVMLKQDKFIHDFGPEFLDLFRNFTKNLVEVEIDFTKNYASVLSNAVPSRHETINTGVTSIIDYINTLFDEKDGTELFEALELVHKFPNTTENAYEVLRKVSKALFAPYLKISGTPKALILIESIKEEIKRARTGAILRRTKENVLVKKDQRRLGFLTHKTRFAVVKRERNMFKKDLIVKNTVKDKPFTYNFYEVKSVKSNKKSYSDVKLVRNITSTTNDAFQKKLARFKIVTSPDKSPKRKPYRPTNKSVEENRHFKDKHSMIYNKYLKLKNVIKDVEVNIAEIPEKKEDREFKYTTFGTYGQHRFATVSKINLPRTYKYKITTTTKKTHEDRVGTMKRKTKSLIHKMPLKKIFIVNSYGVTPPKIILSKKRIHFKDVKAKHVNEYPTIFKSDKKRDHFRVHGVIKDNEDKPPKDGPKGIEWSSYSDEENTLKFNLNDALNHDAIYFRAARKSNTNYETKTANYQSSYSNEEAAIKSNIYKVIGFNYKSRNTTFDDYVPRANIMKGVHIKRKSIQPTNNPSSYSDEEEILRRKLF